jgi:glycosyltransferase involved in cell wall biosynthesis
VTFDGRYPFVTVIMPIRNEAAYIRRSLGAVLSQDYPPDRMEVLVVDGMSEDGTREIVRKTADRRRPTADSPSRSVVGSLPSVFLLDNPARIVPTALNIGLRHARGEVIIRVDGHCEIAPNYVRRCVEVLQETGADNVGGVCITVGETSVARAIGLAQSSLFGVGNVAFRVGRSTPECVDTVPFGAYRREVFERIGGFDEELMRNQDDEFNFRLTQAGGKIWLDPSIRSTYHSRATLRGLWRQYFQYGLYKVRVMQKRRGIPSWRHLVPGAFVLGLCGSVLLALVTRQPLWALGVAGPYAVANGVASLWTARRDPRALPFLPLAFATLHLAYGLGFLWGLWRWRAHHRELIARRRPVQEAPHA